jgi:prostamide/prostaglandin F2alpha synthase
VQLHRARGEFDEAGVRLVLIGQATPRHAAHFRRRLEIDLPVLADESRESYKLAGAKIATTDELVGPAVMAKGIGRALASGGRIRQGRTIGHNAQLGGAMVVKPDGSVAWSHMSENASDNASPSDILAAARKAGTAG